MSYSITLRESIDMYFCEQSKRSLYLHIFASLFILLCLVYGFMPYTVGLADNFTDIFATNSFRGSFSWVKKFDFVGLFIQGCISICSLFGVAALVFTMMTSILYLSAKSVWEEVHDKKVGPEEGSGFFGMPSMIKSWTQGKAGTGVDALFGAVFMLLPDVKEYSEFGSKSKENYGEDCTVTQYILKKFVPALLTIFILAMGWNGTLWAAFGVTVDAMGSIADRAVSINYANILNDLVNKNIGYTFLFNQSGTEKGNIKQKIAMEMYGAVITRTGITDPGVLKDLGQVIENMVDDDLISRGIEESKTISAQLRNDLDSSDSAISDNAYASITFFLDVNRSSSQEGAVSIALSDIVGDIPSIVYADSEDSLEYIHIYFKETASRNSAFINVD